MDMRMLVDVDFAVGIKKHLLTCDLAVPLTLGLFHLTSLDVLFLIHAPPGYLERGAPSPNFTRQYLSNSHSECSISRISRLGTHEGSISPLFPRASNSRMDSIASASGFQGISSRWRPRWAPGPGLAHVMMSAAFSRSLVCLMSVTISYAING